MMIKIILVFAVISAALSGMPEFVSGQWVTISNQGNDAVHFPSINTGYSVSNPYMRKTTNGGYNWQDLQFGNLTGVFFINDLTGWAVGYPGLIRKTTNGGTSWVQQTSGVSDRLNEVFFINDNTGWVVGGDFNVERIFKTTNGGVNWEAQTSGTANKLFSVYFINNDTGWSVGGPSSPKIIKTTNGGAIWFSLNTSGITTPLYSIMFANANTGWAVAGFIGGETIVKTTNGGDNWFSQFSGNNGYLRDCYVIDTMRVIAAGQSGKLIATTNGGLNWNIIQVNSGQDLWGVYFPTDLIGYAVGPGRVMKTTNGGLTFNNENNNKITESYILHQNYPNPFNAITVIKYEIPKTTKAEIKIYDISGKEIAELLNTELEAGKYEARWDAGKFTSGIYFYRLKTAEYTVTNKMLLVK